MIGVLVRKQLRDLRIPLLVVCLLLMLFQMLWARVSKRISSELLPQFMTLTAAGVTEKTLENVIFSGPAKMIQTMMGGENVSIFRVKDMVSVGYVHALIQTIICIWAIGRASSAITGEIDRGTMELLLAQPVARPKIVAAHLCIDAIVIPILCLALWAGNWIGVSLVDLREFAKPPDTVGAAIDPMMFAPGLLNVAALMFAISGYTMWMSARGRFRGKVLGIAVLVTLLQFLVNVIGQLWDVMAPLRPFTVFFYYLPQQLILQNAWTVDLGSAWKNGEPMFRVNFILVLLVVGAAGYLAALRTFCKRDLPAPL